jgi:antitoxin VapB
MSRYFKSFSGIDTHLILKPAPPKGLLTALSTWTFAPIPPNADRYIDDVDIDIEGCPMALEIANPTVVAKIESLAHAMGMTETAVVEWAIDRLAAQTQRASTSCRMAALLAQLDRIPDRTDAFDPLEWDVNGLPK